MPFDRTGMLLLTKGEMWKYGCPKSPVCSDDGLEEERGEDTSSVEYYEHNVDHRWAELDK